MINDLPTLFEIVTGRKPVEDKPSAESGSKSRNNTKVKMSLIIKFKLINAFVLFD
jgi:hypothetical protein